ncbi:unnamed protein product [Cuscuta europaea]|uniref:Uncharacterized protein n=1 Tax=Cuscuta europaea TaxID=41803 RepID=A0A9P0ZS93_CUSEU|nr:unnamed protein product [Cuscuta europaea]
MYFWVRNLGVLHGGSISYLRKIISHRSILRRFFNSWDYFEIIDNLNYFKQITHSWDYSYPYFQISKTGVTFLDGIAKEEYFNYFSYIFSLFINNYSEKYVYFFTI